MFGCAFGGWLCDRIGRWKTIQIQNAVFVLGALVIAGASGVGGLYTGRFIVGIASALSAIADIPYLTEVSSPELRGRLTSAYEMLVVVGILFSFCMNLFLVDVDGGWRWMFGLPAIFAGAQSLLMLSLPESPRWLLEQGRVEEAREVLRHGIEDAEHISRIIEEFQVDISAGLIELNAADNGSSSSSGGGSGSGGRLTKIADGTTDSSDENSDFVGKGQSSGGGGGGSSDGSSSGESDQNHSGSHHMSKAEKTFLEYRPAFACILVLMFFQQFTGGVVIRYTIIVYYNVLYYRNVYREWLWHRCY
jgi:MFS family permease